MDLQEAPSFSIAQVHGSPLCCAYSKQAQQQYIDIAIVTFMSEEARIALAGYLKCSCLMNIPPLVTVVALHPAVHLKAPTQCRLHKLDDIESCFCGLAAQHTTASLVQLFTGQLRLNDGLEGNICLPLCHSRGTGSFCPYQAVAAPQKGSYMSCTHPKLANAAVAHDLLFLTACWCDAVFSASPNQQRKSLRSTPA